MQTIDATNQFMTIREAARGVRRVRSPLRNRIARGVQPRKKIGFARLIECKLLAR